MPLTEPRLRCEVLTVLIAHGSLAQLDAVAEAVLTDYVVDSAEPVEHCPEHAGCHVLALAVLGALSLDGFRAAVRAAIAGRN
ncbi:MAG TPA: hypothetical protein VGP02_00065 [Mycobacteriales bacterium]|jgi:hypothetical protein|nr:hypothetical protein [Mycobacteriales bacterium]